jgi:hypothetical protein
MSNSLNSKFDVEILSSQILAIMHSARQSNEIPRSVWYRALKQIGMTDEDQSFDDFLLEIEKDQTSGHGAHGDDIPAVSA